MGSDELSKYIGQSSMTLIEALEIINNNSRGLIYVVNEKQRLVGCLTDGDIRRYIIKNGQIECVIEKVMNDNPLFVTEEERDKAGAYMTSHMVESVAIVNNEGRITDILFRKGRYHNKNDKKHQALKDIPIIIMAGGKGTRLYPYTRILPKPLIPIGDVPIIERIMDRFSEYGASRFYITVNYKGEMIKAYFNDAKRNYETIFVDEDEPMGTAGSISLIRDDLPKGIVIVTNCDILINEDYDKIVEYHRQSKDDITIVSSLKNMTIPYGVLKTGEDGKVLSMEEKPKLSFLINTGMYIVNTDCLGLIPKGSVFHMTDLCETAMKNKLEVGVFPISMDSFLDMGELQEMKKMEEKIENGKYERTKNL